MFINKNELTQGLRSKDFIDEVFESIKIIPTIGSTVEIENCHFQRCKVRSGNAVLRKCVALKDVTFTDFSCGDAFHISSEVELQNLVVEGQSPSLLWIRPQSKD